MSETKLSATETEIALLRRDASWAATHRSELADLRSAFERAEKKVAAADAMAKALVKMVGHLRNFYDSAEDSSNPIMKAAGKALKEATAALAAYNALK